MILTQAISKNLNSIGKYVLTFLLLNIAFSCKKEMSYEKRSKRDYKLIKVEIEGKLYELESKKICWNKTRCGVFAADLDVKLYDEIYFNGYTWSTFFFGVKEKKKENTGINDFGLNLNLKKESKELIRYSSNGFYLNGGYLKYDQYKNYLVLDSITGYNIQYWNEEERYMAVDMVLCGHNPNTQKTYQNIKIHYSSPY